MHRILLMLKLRPVLSRQARYWGSRQKSGGRIIGSRPALYPTRGKFDIRGDPIRCRMAVIHLLSATQPEQSRASMASPEPPTPKEASKCVGGADKVKRAARDFPPVATTAASKLVPIFKSDGVEAAWTVTGLFPAIPFILTLPCTMTVYRAANGEISLFNALRVSAELEDEIVALGRIAHVIKLGQFHGAADAYWVLCGKFGRPQYWTLQGGTVAKGLTADCILVADNVPVAGAKLYQLEGHPLAEGVMTVPFGAQGPLLVSCDALGHVTDTVGVPIIARAIMNVFGFLAAPGAPQPSPSWCMKTVQMMGKQCTKAMYDGIFLLEWRTFVGAHGVPVLDCDHEACRAAVYKLIGL